jgi:excisionase family DNA binding protein
MHKERNHMPKICLSTAEAAEYLGVSASVLRLWRSQGRGPRITKAGRLVRYRHDELDNWIERTSREPWEGKKAAEDDGKNNDDKN